MPQLSADPAPAWQQVVRPGSRYVALPSRARPLVVAERCPEVLRYVHDALLAAPPGTGVPAWVYAAAEHALGVPGAWALLPDLVTAGGLSGAPPSSLDRFLVAGGWRLLVLQHSRDADASCVVLLFRRGASRPEVAVKLALGEAAAVRVRREAEWLTAFGELPAGRRVRCVPRVLDLLDHAGRPALVTTAGGGVPMFVRYHRRGHTGTPGAVQSDLGAAERWLAELQAVPTGPCRELDVPPGTERGLTELAAVEPAAEAVLERLAGVRRRLRRHRTPATLVHGDFWPGNLLTELGDVSAVVDWEHGEYAGGPQRDPSRFVLGYSWYLGRRTRAGRIVPGHALLVAGPPGAGVRYGLDGSGWYPAAVRGFLSRALARSGLPASCGRDAVLAEVAATAAFASDRHFARQHLGLFLSLPEDEP